jgi:hypothetical protein
MLMDELLEDLKGCNGRYKKRLAEEELERRAITQVEESLKEKHEKQVRQQERKQKQEWVLKTLDEQKEKAAAYDARQGAEESLKEQERAEKEQKQLQIQAQDARRKSLREPTLCKVCNGEGKCVGCDGTGTTSVCYLSSGVGDHLQAFRGKTFSGCRACGGRKDGSELLELKVLKGTGRCRACNGHGQNQLTERQIEFAMQEEESANMGR